MRNILPYDVEDNYCSQYLIKIHCIYTGYSRTHFLFFKKSSIFLNILVQFNMKCGFWDYQIKAHLGGLSGNLYFSITYSSPSFSVCFH